MYERRRGGYGTLALEKSSYITRRLRAIARPDMIDIQTASPRVEEMRPLNTGATPRARAVINNRPFTSHYSSTLQRVDFRQTRGSRASVCGFQLGANAARVKRERCYGREFRWPGKPRERGRRRERLFRRNRPPRSRVEYHCRTTPANIYDACAQ